MNSNANIEFGKRIAYLRNELSLTQFEFAVLCDMDRSYVSSIERGEKSPTLNSIVKLAKGLNVTLKELFDYNET